MCQARERHCRGYRIRLILRELMIPGEKVSMSTANPKSGHGIAGTVEGQAESLGEGNHCL